MSSQFVFFGGKGGVGKTTSAAAFALERLNSLTPRSGEGGTLLVSTDPAHSLGDALGVALGATPKRIRPSLDAVELDAPRAFARWLKEHRRPLGEILEHGTWLDREDVDALLGLSIPGVDELIGILEIDRLASLHAYDRIVVDTAPTGHTLRLLAAPETVAAVAEALGELQHEHRLIREQLARVGRPEAADRLIAALAEQARDTAARLRDPKRTRFTWVTLPEELSVAETTDAIAALERTGIRVAEIVINRVLPAGPPCPLCDRRRAQQRASIATVRKRVGQGRVIRVIPETIKEPRGVKALASLARSRAQGSGLRAHEAKKPSARSPQPSVKPSAISPPPFSGASLLFFGGKGGVGKTTVATSVALHLAREDSGRRVLLLSTDPAHSLGDVLNVPVGDVAATVAGAPKNLIVRELDAAGALAARRAQLEGALDEIAASIGIEGAGPAMGASELMNLAPPGIDELFGVLSVVDARAQYNVIIVDTAPTGHALRLLELPDAARDWMQVLLRVLLKYRALVRPGQLAAELVEVSKSIRELIALLRDGSQTRFIVVTRAAELPRRETARLLARLRRLHLSAPAIVVNARTLVPARCPRCRDVAAAERRELAALRRICGRRCAIIETPLVAPPPRGAKALERWSNTWIDEGLRAEG